jgi:hypothetical protein
MIRNPDVIIIGSLLRLKRDHDFQNLQAWLKESQKELDSLLRHAGSTDTPKLQGGAIALEELLSWIDSAEEVFDRMRKKDSGPPSMQF